jgi:hypothetical protein
MSIKISSTQTQARALGRRWSLTVLTFALAGLLTLALPPATQAALSAQAACFAGPVGGAIGLKWNALGGAAGPLGCATSPEIPIPNLGVYIVRREFLHGAIYHERGTGEFAVYGAIFNAWDRAGREHSRWGLPISDELTTSDGRGRFSQFEGGTLAWWADAGIKAYFPLYYLTVDSYQISRTRSRHEDTNFVYVGATQNTTLLNSRQWGMGDQNDGFYRVGLKVGAVIRDRAAPFAFSYAITNKGHGNSEDLKNALDKAVPEAGALAAKAGPVGAIIGGVVVAGYEATKDLIFADCDGIVADAVVQGDLRLFSRWTAGQQVHTETRFHPGYDSPHGCGANSEYTVTWSVSRWAP